MAAYKWTMLLQIATNANAPNASIRRVGGWTESWYSQSAPSQSLQDSFRTLCQKRAACLGIGGSCVGFRIQQVDPRAPSQQQSLVYASASTLTTDQPGASILVSIGSAGVANVRREKFAGVPDSYILNGELIAGSTGFGAFAAFFAELAGWRFRGRDLTTPLVNLASIAADGTYTTQSDLAAPQGSVVVVRRVQDATKVIRGGTFTVGTATSLRTGILNKWTYGPCTLGSITLYVPIYPIISLANIVVGRAGFRKVGRPFVGYVGRRSKRKK